MANQVMEKDGSYFSVNPASKNMKELNTEELYSYLLNKKTLTPKEIEWAFRIDRNNDANITASKLSDSDIARHVSGDDPLAYSLSKKAMLQLAYDRGAQTTEERELLDFNPSAGLRPYGESGPYIPPKEGEGLTGSNTYVPRGTKESGFDPISPRSNEYPFDYIHNMVSEDKVNDFQAFTADQALKTQQIADNFEKYNSNSTFDAESSVNLLKDLNHEFASIDSSYLEKLHDASKSNLNFTGLNSGNAVIEAVKDMANNDRPLGESLYDESLEILDNIVMTNLKQMKRVGDIFGESVGYRRVVKPTIEMVSKFGETVGNAIEMGAEKLASKMAAQDPVTNKLPPLYLTDEEFKQQYMNDDAQLQEGFEETFQNTYGGMPELKKLEE